MLYNTIRFTKTLTLFDVSKYKLAQAIKLKHILQLFTTGMVAQYLYSTFWNISIQFEHHPEAVEKHIVEYFKDIQYIPTFYIPHRLLQLTYATRLEEKIDLKYERQLFNLKDGGQVALDWLNKDLNTNKPIILITHGLTGGSDSNYIRHASIALQQNGYQVVCFNQRGVADCELLTSRYHFHGCTQDLKEVISYLDQIKQNNQQIYGLGFSIGANLLLKYAGQEKNECKLNRIVSISNPYNLLECSYNILKWRNKIYNWSITNNFKQLLTKNKVALIENEQHKGIEFNKALAARNTYEFDELITRRLFDFSSPEELYKNIGCEDYLNHIQVPVLCLHAKDDPIVPKEVIPLDKLRSNPNIMVAMTNKGAHVEWFSGLNPQRWIMNPVLRYFELHQK